MYFQFTCSRVLSSAVFGGKVVQRMVC